jgi:hypothetical protein
VELFNLPRLLNSQLFLVEVPLAKQ